MNLDELQQRLVAVLGERDDMLLVREPLHHASGDYSFLKAQSVGIGPLAPVLLIAAGIHGDERSGPLTLAHRGEELIDYAHSRGVGLIIYPLRNPSGYDKGLRYNADHDRGAEGNNDFLRYLLADGSVTSSLATPAPAHEHWLWSSDPRLGVPLAAETRLMHRLLQADPLHLVRAAIDLHQDHLTPNAPPAAYHYAFGDLSVYEPITARIATICPLLRRTSIGAGFGTRIDREGQVIGAPSEARARPSDERGFIVRHDGTLTDLLHRVGVRHSITAETTGATPMGIAISVNRIWVEGLVDSIAADPR